MSSTGMGKLRQASLHPTHPPQPSQPPSIRKEPVDHQGRAPASKAVMNLALLLLLQDGVASRIPSKIVS
jgi:hypothetical protein